MLIISWLRTLIIDQNKPRMFHVAAFILSIDRTGMIWPPFDNMSPDSIQRLLYYRGTLS